MTAALSDCASGSNNVRNRHRAQYLRIIIKPFLARSTDEVPLKGLSSKTVGSFTATRLVSTIEKLLNGHFKHAKEESDVVLHYVWEKFNIGHWKDVRIEWRHAYYIASYIKAMALCLGDNSPVSGPEAAVRAGDMGLLMGAPVSIRGKENILREYVAALHGAISGRAALGLFHRSSPVISDSIVQTKDISRGTGHGVMKDSDSEDLHMNSSSDVDDDCTVSRSKASRKCQCDSDDGSLSKRERLIPPSLPPLGGSQHGSVIPRLHCPSVEEFKRLHLDGSCPVVLEGCMGHWPALSSRMWTLDYIKHVAALRTVPVEVGSRYTDDSWSQTLMTIREFIETHIGGTKGRQSPPAPPSEISTGAGDISSTCVNSPSSPSPVGYLAQHPLFEQIPELREDISVPEYCALGNRPVEEVEVNAWFGPAGTVSPLHHDPKHNFLSQVMGEKRIRVYSPSTSPLLYPHDSEMFSNTSRVDVECVDKELFPRFGDAQWAECILTPGDMLYMPPKWWHFVKSLSVSFSVSFWWE